MPGVPASSRTAVAERPSLEQQYGSCRKEISQCQLRLSEAEKEQLALGKRVQAGEALIADLGACRANAAALQTKRLDLEQALPQVGPRPGAAVFAAFPQGPGSIELRLCAAGALIAGFLLGRPGRRQGWAKFAAGSAGALLALLVFSGILALLPDSRWPERLLSLTAALLLMSLTAFRRFARQRVRDGELSLPEAEEAIDLDEAERALAGHREEGGEGEWRCGRRTCSSPPRTGAERPVSP